MRTMYDAVTARNIPRNPPPELVAGYIDKIKLEPWSPADWALFPNSRKVEIVKKADTNSGHVLDVEPGDATPAEAPGWVAMRRRSGFAYPVIYCNQSTWDDVQTQFIRQGVPQPLYWIAHYDGIADLPVLAGITAIAKQYLGDQAPGFDKSCVADYWPGVDPAPATAAPMEDIVKDLPAGEHMIVRLFCAGRPHFLWWEINDNTSDGRPHQGVIEDIAYIRRTPTTPDADYGPLGQDGYPDLRGWVFNKDRSGPIQFADDVAWLRLIVSCDGESSMAVG